MLHEPHGLLTYEFPSPAEFGFLCLTCGVGSLCSALHFRLIPTAFDLYMDLLRKEEAKLIRVSTKKF